MTSPLHLRPRRLRTTPNIRRMVRESTLSVDDLVYPIFVTDGSDIQLEIPSMPGIHRWSVDRVAAEAETVAALGIPAVLLFGIPEHKDSHGTESHATDGVVQRAVRTIKEAAPDLVVMTDVCLCEYTDHGHCGVLNEPPHAHPRYPAGYLLNDETLEILELIAVSHAAAGADIVAPSGMIDGMVATIREALDEAEFDRVAIMAYSAKYASAFYGPFRDAADGAPKSGDRSSHQMDPSNGREALKEVALDINEGADIVMVKPALAYLDIIRSIGDEYPEIPLAAYNVSGEFSMIKAAAARGWTDERRTVLETLTAMKRAGADIIITYHAKDVATWLAV